MAENPFVVSPPALRSIAGAKGKTGKSSPKIDRSSDLQIDEFSEEKLALDFVKRHQEKVRYVGDLKEWFIFDGHHWRLDTSRQIFDWAREICREAGDNALSDPKTQSYARSITSGKARYQVASVSSDDQRIALQSCQFDEDPLSLGGPPKPSPDKGDR